MKKASIFKKIHFRILIKSFFWFILGAMLGLFFFVSFTFIIFQHVYHERVFPGITINNLYLGGKTKEEVKNYFLGKNAQIPKSVLTFTLAGEKITLSAEDLQVGYNDSLLSDQVYMIGRSADVFSNVSLIFTAYLSGLNLSPSYRYSQQATQVALDPFAKKVYKEPVNALFTFKNGKVTVFQPSSEGAQIDFEEIKNEITKQTPFLVTTPRPLALTVAVPIKTLKPQIPTEKANNLGVKEEIASGTSLFQDSILNRVHNVTLAATKMNGVLVAPNEEFSFNKALGDVSAFTGYKQAYIIENGKTVLGDGGGVCQVSTTLFRAILQAGLQVTERHAHAYRVHYYEEDSPPGIDATVFSPTVDLQFKNDTGNYILIQSEIDPVVERLTFRLFGTKDGRISTITTPVIVSQTKPPEPLYQDDPALPKGIVKQVDFAAWGANIYFTRSVVRNGKTIISEKYISNYTPWKAVFLRGTKEG